MFIHWALQEIHLKIVYYGPFLSGKTANLQHIHSRIDPALRGDLVKLKAHEDNSIFYDFLQMEIGKIEGKTTKFNLYTIPGSINCNITRRTVLNGVDGIVFVADSRKEVMDANFDTLLDLERNLITWEKTLENFPWVLQYNKRDLSSAQSIEDMEQKLNFFGIPSFEATATQGNGVFATLKEITKQVVSIIQSRLKSDQRMRA